MAKVVLSYSREDRHVADRIAHDLTDSGIEVWYDANLDIGENWVEVISQKHCSARRAGHRPRLLLPQSQVKKTIFHNRWLSRRKL